MEFKKKKKTIRNPIYSMYTIIQKKNVYNYVHNFPKNIHNIVH